LALSPEEGERLLDARDAMWIHLPRDAAVASQAQTDDKREVADRSGLRVRQVQRIYRASPYSREGILRVLTEDKVRRACRESRPLFFCRAETQ
jgi:hypothetical protein